MTDSTPPAAASTRVVLAASAPWLGALLNVLPGLGAGYLYQRRWIAWWLTNALATACLVLGAWWAAGSALPALQPAAATVPLPTLAGLSLLSLVTAVEAFLAARRARID